MKTIEFAGVEGNRIVADLYKPNKQSAHPPVLLVHGGGQTRHAWRGTARALAIAGFTAIAMDQRGHGDSAWVGSKAYAFYDFAADLAAVCKDIEQQYGRRPIVVGASLGGLAALLAEGRAARGLLGGLVLVDVTPRMDPDGIRRIHGFMGERMSEGFATLEEAAAAISAYLPARRKPATLSGLAKNLRRGDDGRYRWHWDPAFMGGPRPVNFERASVEAELDSVVAKLKVATLLVRGCQSELVTEEAVADFLKAAPHARYVDVLGAGHMVAGDKNDAFTDAVITFLLEEQAVAS